MCLDNRFFRYTRSHASLDVYIVLVFASFEVIPFRSILLNRAKCTSMRFGRGADL
jgi:hypothetical protein